MIAAGLSYWQLFLPGQSFSIVVLAGADAGEHGCPSPETADPTSQGGWPPSLPDRGMAQHA